MPDPHCIIVPVSTLSPNQEQKLVEYFNQAGMKRLPHGLPYADWYEDGKQTLGISAGAVKELEKLAADKDMEVGLCSMATFLFEGAPRCKTMWVKKLKVMGKEQFTELTDKAYQKLNEAADPQ